MTRGDAGRRRGAPRLEAGRLVLRWLASLGGGLSALIASIAPIASIDWAGWCAAADEAADERWPAIAAAFDCPLPFADQLGALRPVLEFNDGSPVRSADDWARRRGEILAAWHEQLGPWPAPLEHPRMETLRLESLPSSGAAPLERRRVRIEIGPQQRSEAWLLIPAADRPRPAVIVVYYDAETSVGLGQARLRDYGAMLAERGFVTLSIGTPGGDAWRPDTGGARCQPLAFYASVAANLWRALADLPEVDSARIGIVGHSYGGKWAMFAACLFEPFACGAWSDPGVQFDESRPNVNYWEPWYLGFEPGVKPRTPGLPSVENPSTGAYRRLIAGRHDLHELQALMAPRPFLVSGGAEDPPERWIALNHAVAVNRLLGYERRVGMTNRAGHDPTAASNAQLCAFFRHFLGQPADGRRN